jgi:hypothetical protein
MTKKTSPDRAYLIRCWQENAAASSGALPDTPRWHLSVEEVLHERKRWGFEDLEALFAFLRAELELSQKEQYDES